MVSADVFTQPGTVAALLGFNKKTVQRVFQLRGWQVKKRPIGFRTFPGIALRGYRAKLALGD